MSQIKYNEWSLIDKIMFLFKKINKSFAVQIQFGYSESELLNLDLNGSK